MPTELIINGSFSSGSAGWSGTDIEATYTEGVYQGNGSSNNVAEVNGSANQTTVMEQTFTVPAGQTTELTFDAALRASGPVVAGQDGFTVEIIDENGVVILTETILPTTTDFTTYTYSVTFPDSGDYTIRITEVGPNDSYGALVDDISLMVCLTAGTMIETPDGPRAIEALVAGDMVQTRAGAKPIQWIGRRKITAAEMARNPKLCPVRIRRGALGPDLPNRDLLTSRQHRMLICSKIAKRMFDTQDALVSAIRLTELPGIDVVEDLEAVEYFHVLLEGHEILTANGAPTESLLAGPIALRALSEAAREEILTLFPEAGQMECAATAEAVIPSRKRQIRLVERHKRNRHVALVDLDEDGQARVA